MRLKARLLMLASTCWVPLLAYSQAPASQTAEQPSGPPPPAKVVTFVATDKNVKSVFGVSTSVAALHPGDTLDTNTLDSFGGVIASSNDTLSKVKAENPLTGPFYIEGAQAGDTLVIKFLDLAVDGDQGIGAIGAGFGALSSSTFTPMLNHDLPERFWFFPIDRTNNVATFKASDTNFTTKIPLHPFLGCIGTAPANGEARTSLVSGQFGGNMDTPEASVGHTLYLPVNVPGALLYLGDGHAAMGDGEVAGTAIEVPMHVKIQIDLVPGKMTPWPRFENDDYLMAIGIGRPLEDATRIAYIELIKWVHDEYGLSQLDLYELMSVAGELRVSEIVDPSYVVVAKINKKYLPPKLPPTPPLTPAPAK